MRILSASLFLTTVASLAMFFYLAISAPNLRPALTADRVQQQVQASTDLQELRAAATGAARTLGTVATAAEEQFEFACGVFALCAACSGIGLLQVWRFRKRL